MQIITVLNWLLAIHGVAAAGRFRRNGRFVRRQSGPVDPGQPADCTWWETVVDETYTCEYMEEYYGISRAVFLEYNPTVNQDCSNLKIGNSYCVEVNFGLPRPTTAPTSTSTHTTASPTTTGGSNKPSPTQEGLIETCTRFYQAVSGDTCDEIATKNGNAFNFADFLKWNPAVGQTCNKILPGYYYCVGVPGSPTTTNPGPTTTNDPSKPSPTQEGLISTCNKFYQAVGGDTCDEIARKNGNSFSFADFLKWNPAVGQTCNKILPYYYYCVGVPGSGSPTTTPGPTTTNDPSKPSPTQSGLISTCDKFYQAVGGDTCDEIARKHSNAFSFADFYKWNPAVGQTCGGLLPYYYYCVGVPGSGSLTTTPGPTTTSDPSKPSPTQAGLISTCNKFYQAVGGDTCDAIASKHSNVFTFADFLKWNPAVGQTCGGLLPYYWYCVGVPGSGGTPCNPDAPSPTQPTPVCGCKRWHKVGSGDGCDVIAAKYGVTAAQLKSWNSGLGATCSVWFDYYICVGV